MFELQVPDLLTEFDQDHPVFYTNTPEEFPDRLGQYYLALASWRWDLKSGQLTPFYCYTNGMVYLTVEAVGEIFKLSAAISLQAQGERASSSPAPQN